jgi:transposase InsO family protein
VARRGAPGAAAPARERTEGAGHKAASAWAIAASGADDVWSYDFVAFRTEDGLPLRILNVVDEFTRRCLGSKVARHLGARDVAAFLEELFERHGRPRLLRSDNGREFIAQSLADWLTQQGVAQAFIEKGMPQQNAYVERFNGSMRDEVLNGELFHSVLEARVVIAEWVQEYNTLRPHRGLGMRTPAAFFESINEGRA